MLANGVVSAAYIAASILFILSLGGLSNQESAKRAVWYGIVGMAIAVVATILILMPWILRTLRNFAETLFRSLAELGAVPF